MEEIWTRIKACLKTNAPQALEVLQPGVSDAQISELEDFLNVKLPEDMKASYCICNGQSDFDFGLIEGFELLSLEHIKQEWKTWKELLDSEGFKDYDGQDFKSDPDRGISNVWWSPQWIPLTHDGGGNHNCLDLNPTEEGTMGQIITMWHDDSERKIIAPSFRSWLQQYVEDLESGQLIFSAEYNGIIRIEDIN